MHNLPVHWFEGMFLRPQHFQAADRAWAEALDTSEHWDHEYNYGIRSIEISADAVANYQIQVSSDLIAWAPLQTLTCTETSTPVTDPGPLGSKRFYRVVGQ